jgi:hypothetical protein
MWTDAIARENAAPRQVIAVPADGIQVVRAYVTVPVGERASEFKFRLTSLDEQAEQDIVEVRFAGPGDAQ